MTIENNFPKTLLVIASEWPEPASSAAGSRMMQILDIFLNLGFEITYCATAHISEFMFDLKSIGIKINSITLNNDGFDDFIKTICPSVILFDRFTSEEQFGWRVISQFPNAMRILDTEDLHFLRKARQQSILKHNDLNHVELQSDVAKREVASILRCDMSLIISKFEMELLQNEFGIKSDLLFFMPFMLDPIDDEVTAIWPSFEQRKNFIFIGNFFHEPNVDSVMQLKTAIWPKICKLQKGLKIDIYGAYPSPKIMQLHQPSNGFLVHGRAENAEKLVGSAKVLLAPIRFGAGIKGKLAEAQFCGTPSITTRIGAESMSENGFWNGFITDDYDEFAAKSVEIYHDKMIWENAQKNGQMIYNKQYDKSVFTAIFCETFKKIQNNLEQHRRKNFFGAMLLHHSMQSTKYMSKWIIAKNK